MMDTKTVIVNFQYISAYQALENILKQCGKGSVLLAIDEINIEDDENWPVSLVDYPICTCQHSGDGTIAHYRNCPAINTSTAMSTKKQE